MSLAGRAGGRGVGDSPALPAIFRKLSESGHWKSAAFFRPGNGISGRQPLFPEMGRKPGRFWAGHISARIPPRFRHN